MAWLGVARQPSPPLDQAEQSTATEPLEVSKVLSVGAKNALKTLILHDRPTPSLLLCEYQPTEAGLKHPEKGVTDPEAGLGEGEGDHAVLLSTLMSGRLRGCHGGGVGGGEEWNGEGEGQ